ncbi:hypothetical protein GE061_007816 [Apolygus lucorum]|uniref:Uncharacterized protein n=1 Tax=Apolygus lucorum TaxID=248454 RepID=A0A8S9WLT1_APOLU|nr:hypothetical protein GE061_007816 [Apolygus lucorum]
MDIPTAAASAGTLQQQTPFDSDLLRIDADPSVSYVSPLLQEGATGNIQAGDQCNPGTLPAPATSATTTFASKRRDHEKGEAACHHRPKRATYAEVTRSQTAPSPLRPSPTLHHTCEEANPISRDLRKVRRGCARAHQQPEMERLAGRHTKHKETGKRGPRVLPRQKQ